MDFSRHYAARAHQTQRWEPVLYALPSLNEIEDMLQIQRQNEYELTRTRTAVVNQEQARAEQIAQRKAFKPGGVDADEHMAMNQEDSKGASGFAGADAKKRRGVSFPKERDLSFSSPPFDELTLFLQKAAPPGRCQNCNRAETPEWHLEQDRSRMLCNVCHLHYAKLTRKMDADKYARSPGRLDTNVSSKGAQRGDCFNQKNREKHSLTPTTNRNLKRRKTSDSSSSSMGTPETNNTSPLLEPKYDVPSWVLPLSFESLLLQWTTLQKQEIQPLI